MAKILIIPDVHGTHNWELALSKIDKVDHVVFLGDYFDSWTNQWPDQGENFESICKFKRKYPSKVHLLLGNHCFSYLSGTREGSNCSGHQHSKIHVIRALLRANNDILDLAFECDGWVFSHAGFSKTWVNSMKHQFHLILDKYPDDGKRDFASQEEFEQYQAKINKSALIWDENEWSVFKLNEVWHARSHLPSDENFDYGFDELLDWHGCFSGSGDEITQGPLWIRPHSLLKDAYYSKQVVGHTEYCFGNYTAWKKDDNIVVMCDSRNHRIYSVFDTEELPVNPVTEIEWQRNTKKLDKRLGVIKSTFGMLKSETGHEVSEKDQRKKLVDEFGEIGNEYYELFFKKA